MKGPRYAIAYLLVVHAPQVAHSQAATGQTSPTALRPCGETLFSPRSESSSLRAQAIVADALRPDPGPDKEVLWLFVVQPSFQPEWSIAGIRKSSGGGDAVELRIASDPLDPTHREYILKGQGPVPVLSSSIRSRQMPAEVLSGIQRAAFQAAFRARYEAAQASGLDGISYHFFAQGRGVTTVCSTTWSPKKGTDAEAMTELAAAIREAASGGASATKNTDARLLRQVEATLAALAAHGP